MSNDGKSFAERFSKRNSTTESTSMTEKYGKKESNMKSEQLAQKSPSNLSNSQADLVYLVKGVDNGKNAWYYILVERLKLSLFLKALNDDIIHLENYGKILYSAYGDEPPQSITDKLKEEYGIN